jgi:hypothetical protein
LQALALEKLSPLQALALEKLLPLKSKTGGLEAARADRCEET